MTNDELVQSLAKSGALKSPAMIEAFKKVDRKDFVPEEYADEAYEDYPLPIGHHQTISQPYTVAFMLELLDVKPGEKILDVGSGSGWTAALLAELAGLKGKVFGVEVVPELVKFGRANLAKYAFPHATIEKAGAARGLPREAPFDKILVSAAAEQLPEELVRQLKIGGRMVAPVANSVWRIDRVSETELDEEEFPGFSFVPLQ